jgi:hypothetical protein
LADSEESFLGLEAHHLIGDTGHLDDRRPGRDRHR